MRMNGAHTQKSQVFIAEGVRLLVTTDGVTFSIPGETVTTHTTWPQLAEMLRERRLTPSRYGVVRDGVLDSIHDTRTEAEARRDTIAQLGWVTSIIQIPLTIS